MIVSRVSRLLALPAILAIVTQVLPAQQREEEGADVKRRREAFREARADASGKLSVDDWVRAWHSWKTLPAYSAARMSSVADAAWRSIGPNAMFGNQVNFGGIGQLVAGRVTGIGVHPTDGRIMYVAAASGGVWKTTNGGATWAPLTDQQCSPSMGSVAVDPVNPNIIYAGTGEINTFEFPGCGVLRSTDGGNTWTAPQTNPVGPYHGKILVDPNTAGSATSTTVLAATGDIAARTTHGLFVSFNSGQTWQQKLPGVVFSVVAVQGRPGLFYASVVNDNRIPRSSVWRSTDGGVTWNELPTPAATTTQFARIELATSANAPGVVTALVGDLQTRRIVGIFRWNEFSPTAWTRLNASGLVTDMSGYPFTLGEQAEYDLVVAVDPRNNNRIWVAGVGAFISEGGGQTFRSTAKTVHVDWHSLVFSPSDADHMIAGTDGGVYVSHDGGKSWRAQNNGLQIAQFYTGVSVHPSGLWVFGGLQDNQAAYFSGSPIWNNFSQMGDGGYTAVNPQNPRIVYVTHAFANFILRKNGTFVEESRSNGIFQNDRGGTRRPLVMDPTNPNTLYFGTQRMYRTVNEGLLWQPISFDLTRGSGYITTIAVAPSNPQVIYAGTSDGVIAVSTDGGFQWNQFAFQVNRFFTKIVVDPNDPLHAVGLSSTFSAPKITETRDGGQGFNSTISANLPNVPVHTALFIPGTGTFMAGTEFGVMQTTDAGFTWTLGPPGMPVSIVYDLAYAPATSTVIASTYGRGMFAWKAGATTTVLRGDIDGNTQVNAADAFLLQQALVGVDLAPLSPYPQGDANCDTRLESIDVVVVLRASVGLPNPGACVGSQARQRGRRLGVVQ
jgi:photosystem II stability/assembly factor-like uncharacterized protein